MEPKFQTSFIPKKQNSPSMGGIGNSSLQKPKVHGASLFMAISIFMFVASIGSLAGIYFWKSYLIASNESYKNELASKEKQFNLRLIESLKQINFQIDSAKNILNNHLAVSKIFNVIQELTISDVRFVSMDFKAPATSGGNMAISMRGYGKNLAALAFQSDVLGKLSELNLSNIVKNPIVSNPVLDDKDSVTFSFSADIDPKSLLYKSTTNP